MQIVDHHIVYKDPAYYCGPGPSVVCDPDTGRLTIAFRRVKSWLNDGLAGHWHPGTETCLTHSDDLGRTWTPPRVILSGWQCPCLTRLSDGTLLHSSHRFEPVSSEILDRVPDTPGLMTSPWPGIHAGTAIHRSTDGGINWSEPTWLNGLPGVEPLHPALNLPVAVRGNVLELPSGRLLISAYSLGTDNTSCLFESDDAGRSWSCVGAIADDHNETYLHETPDGDLLAWMRACGDRMPDFYLSRSTDGVRSWSEPQKMFRGFPATCAPFGSGNLLVVYGYRYDDMGVRARVFSPGGTEPSEEISIRDDGAVSDLGYPHAVSLPDGRVMVAYYINRKTDAEDQTAPRYVECCVVAE